MQIWIATGLMLLWHSVSAVLWVENTRIETVAYFASNTSHRTWDGCLMTMMMPLDDAGMCRIPQWKAPNNSDCNLVVLDWSVLSECGYAAVNMALNALVAASVNDPPTAAIIISNNAYNGSLGSPHLFGEAYLPKRLMLPFSFSPPALPTAFVSAQDWSNLINATQADMQAPTLFKKVSFTNDPGPWNRIYNSWFWRSSSWIFVALFALLCVMGYYYLWTAYRSSLLHLDFRLVVFLLTLLSCQLLIPTPVLPQPTYMHVVLEHTADFLFAMAFLILCLFWLQLLAELSTAYVNRTIKSVVMLLILWSVANELFRLLKFFRAVPLPSLPLRYMWKLGAVITDAMIMLVFAFYVVQLGRFMSLKSLTAVHKRAILQVGLCFCFQRNGCLIVFSLG